MRDLSLHILDLIENSVSASSVVVSVTIEVLLKDDLLRTRIEDDGCGFKISPDVAFDPFYTTKSGKKTGLGLSLFRSAVQRAGGDLVLGKSRLGGAMLNAQMRLSHPDRSPVGDLAGSFSTMVCTHPEVDFRLAVECWPKRFFVSSEQIGKQVGDSPVAVAREISKVIQAGMKDVWPEHLW